MNERIKGYLTKYGLTAKVGYIEYTFSSDKEYIRDGGWGFCKIGVEFFTSRDDAVADVVKRKEKKLASLRKQIAKLEAVDPEKQVL